MYLLSIYYCQAVGWDLPEYPPPPESASETTGIYMRVRKYVLREWFKFKA